MTWPGLLGHCLTFFVPRAWVWYQEKNQVAREAGGGAGEDFRAILTRGPGLSLPGEIGGHREIKPVSSDCPFPASGNVGDLQLSSQGMSCEVGIVRNSVCR